MPDEQIEIVIKAVDEMSATLKNIESNIVTTTENTTKQTQQLSKSFTESAENLIALGNAARAVDNIFSSYQNLQLRLENATERVTGAQERLEDAQIKLNRLYKSGSASLEELTDAQREVDRASRSLTVSQNNLQRAQNQVIGTYINMGVQITTLIASFPKLINNIRAMTTASIAFASTPLGVALIALSSIIGVLTFKYLQHKESTKDLTDSQKQAEGQVYATTTAFSEQQKMLNELRTELQRFSEIPLAGEPEAKKDIIDKKRLLIDLEEARRNLSKEAINLDTEEGRSRARLIEQEKQVLETKIINEEESLKRLEKLYTDSYTAQHNIVKESIDLKIMTVLQGEKDTTSIYGDSLNEQLKMIEDFAQKAISAYNQVSKASSLTRGKTINFVSAGGITVPDIPLSEEVRRRGVVSNVPLPEEIKEKIPVVDVPSQKEVKQKITTVNVPTPREIEQRRIVPDIPLPEEIKEKGTIVDIPSRRNDVINITLENVIKLDGKVINRSLATDYGNKVSL